MPDSRASALDRRPRAGTSGGPLLPCRVHPAARVAHAYAGKPGRALQFVVPCCGRDPQRGRSKPETPWRRHWVLRHPAHGGTEPVVPSSRPLCHSRRRTRTGPQAVGSFPFLILLACKSSGKSLPWQVHRWFAEGLPHGTFEFLRTASALESAKALRGFPANV